MRVRGGIRALAARALGDGRGQIGRDGTFESPASGYRFRALTERIRALGADVDRAAPPPAASTPSIAARGTVAKAAGGSNLSVSWPAGHVAGQVGLLIVVSPNESNALVGSPPEWTLVREVSIGTQSGTTSIKASIYWARATSGAMADAVVTNANLSAGNSFHIARIVTYDGCIESGDPVDVHGGDTATNTTGVTLPSVTTTVDDVLVVQVVADARDNDASNASGYFQNAALDYGDPTGGLPESANTALGNGGGFYDTAGVMPSAGVTGTTTFTLQNASNQGRLLVGLKGNP